MNEFLLGLNFLGMLASIVFYVCSQLFVPTYWGAYVDGFTRTVIFALFSFGPFLVNYLVLQNNIRLSSEEPSKVCIISNIILVATHLLCLRIAYLDQFGNSRGFGLVASIAIYLSIFPIAWVVLLIFLFLERPKKI